MNKILIVDDEESIRFVLKKGIEKMGYIVQTAQNSSEAISKINKENFFLAFFDIVMPGGTGLNLLEKAKNIAPDMSVIIMTAQDTMKNAISAMQKGAYDYISKPFDFDEISLLVKKILDLQQLKKKVVILETELKNRFEAGEIIGKSKKIREVFKIIGRAAASDLPILITGESGTGKELAAKAIHQNSKRVVGPFISLNCAAIPANLMESEMFGHEKGAFTGADKVRKGKFELANTGTLFLDEIGDMQTNLQAKILRVLQENEFVRVGGRETIKCNVRIISATNKDLKAVIKQGIFREDLYHRLNVITMQMPPLRERQNDILELALYFMEQIHEEMGGQPKTLTGDALALLKKYDWKGNVRELENVIKRTFVLSYGKVIAAEHLPDFIKTDTIHDRSGLSSGKASSKTIFEEKIKNLAPYISNMVEEEKLYDIVIKNVEKVLFDAVLKETEMNQIKAAKILGLNRNTLARKMKKFKQ